MKKNKKVKMTFNIDPKVRRQIKNLVEDLGYKSESAFCCEAIEEYLSKLQYDSIGTTHNHCLLFNTYSEFEKHIRNFVSMTCDGTIHSLNQ